MSAQAIARRASRFAPLAFALIVLAGLAWWAGDDLGAWYRSLTTPRSVASK